MNDPKEKAREDKETDNYDPPDTCGFWTVHSDETKKRLSQEREDYEKEFNSED
jgi:hypothetical protein